MHRCLLVCLLLATTATADDAVVSRTYDVRWLQTRGADAPVVELGLVAPPVPPPPPPAAATDGSDCTIGGGVLDLVRDNVDKDSWEREHTIRQYDGRLYVRHRPATQRAVARLLALLDAASARRTRFELLRVQGPAGALGGLLRAGGTVDPSRLSGPGWRVIERRRLTAVGGQRTAAGLVRRTPVPTRLVLHHGQVVADPELLATGRRIAVRAMPSRDGRRLRVRYRWTEAEAGELRTLPLSGLPGAATIEQPRLTLGRAGGAALMPAGGAVVLATRADGDAQELLVLRHLDPPPAGPQPDVERLTVLDVGFLTVSRDAIRGPAIGSFTLKRVETEPLGRFYGDAPISREALVELIKSKVEPDSWERGNSSIDMSGGLMVVVNAPPVLARIRAFVDALEARNLKPVWVRGVWIGAAGARLAALRARVGVDLDAKAVAAIDAGLTADERRADLALALESGQRGHVARLGQARHVAGYAANPLLPVIGLAQWGALLDVQATRVAGGRVALDLRAADVDPPTWRRVPFRHGLPLELPRMTSVDLETSLELPLGGGRLVDLGHGRLLLLEAR